MTTSGALLELPDAFGVVPPRDSGRQTLERDLVTQLLQILMAFVLIGLLMVLTTRADGKPRFAPIRREARRPKRLVGR